MQKIDYQDYHTEEFVFNVETKKDLSKSKKLIGVEYRLGKQAYDIKGNKLDPSYMLPVFVKKTSLDLLDENWAKELGEVR